MDTEEWGIAQEEKAEATATSGKQKITDISQIMKDPEQSVLFIARLRAKSEKSALDRYLGNDYSMDDVKELNKQAVEFNELAARAKEVARTLNPKDLESIIRSSPDLKEIYGLKEGGIQLVIGRYLPELAMRDNASFEEIARTVAMREETRKEGAANEEVIETFCQKHGIKKEEYFELIQSEDEERLREVVRSKLGFWRKWWANSEKTYEAVAREIAAIPDQAKIAQYNEALQSDRKRIGDALALTLIKNEQMRKALRNETLGLGVEEIEGEKRDMSFPDMQEVMNMGGEQLREKFEEWLKRLGDQSIKQKYGFADPGHPDFKLENAHADFGEYYKEQRTKGKTGYFKDVFKEVIFPKVLKRLL